MNLLSMSLNPNNALDTLPTPHIDNLSPSISTPTQSSNFAVQRIRREMNNAQIVDLWLMSLFITLQSPGLMSFFPSL